MRNCESSTRASEQLALREKVKGQWLDLRKLFEESFVPLFSQKLTPFLSPLRALISVISVIVQEDAQISSLFTTPTFQVRMYDSSAVSKTRKNRSFEKGEHRETWTKAPVPEKTKVWTIRYKCSMSKKTSKYKCRALFNFRDADNGNDHRSQYQ